jgi:hypothetical protein
VNPLREANDLPGVCESAYELAKVRNAWRRSIESLDPSIREFIREDVFESDRTSRMFTERYSNDFRQGGPLRLGDEIGDGPDLPEKALDFHPSEIFGFVLMLDRVVELEVDMECHLGDRRFNRGSDNRAFY